MTTEMNDTVKMLCYLLRVAPETVDLTTRDWVDNRVRELCATGNLPSYVIPDDLVHIVECITGGTLTCSVYAGYVVVSSDTTRSDIAVIEAMGSISKNGDTYWQGIHERGKERWIPPAQCFRDKQEALKCAERLRQFAVHRTEKAIEAQQRAIEDLKKQFRVLETLRITDASVPAWLDQ